MRNGHFQSDLNSWDSLASSNTHPITIDKRLGSNSWASLQKSTSLFSSSLPVLPHEKLNTIDLDPGGESLDNSSSKLSNLCSESKDPLEEFEVDAIGNLLPDDEELFAGIMDDFDLNGLPTQLEDLDDDLFDSGGGMEMDLESQASLSYDMSKLNVSDSVPISGIGHYAISSGAGTISGEHPYGEHPSRTLFVRNINSNVEDSELRDLFEQYGDIRTLYTACKHRGFVMISYYDIRAARTAMRALQSRPLRRRKLDIHFSIPKDNPSEKDINQGTLVVFNLDPSVSNDELFQIFGAYGEVKEIRETPNKRHHKFIEFYDVRAAEAALKALNRAEIAGKRIKLEPSRPGGARRNLMQQLSQDLEQDEARSFRHHVGSPVANSPPGNWVQYGSPVGHSPLHAFGKSPGLGSPSPMQRNHLPGLASLLPSQVSNSAKVMPISQDQGRFNIMNQKFHNTGLAQGSAYQQFVSFPEQKLDSSPGLISIGESKSNASGAATLSGSQFLWGSPTCSEHTSSSAWSTSSNGLGLRIPYPNHHGSFHSLHNHNLVGSAPPLVPFDRNFGYISESPETALNPDSLGGLRFGHSSGNYVTDMTSLRNGFPIDMARNGSPMLRNISLPKYGPMFLGNGSFPGSGATSIETMVEHVRSRRVESSITQKDDKKQFQLNLDKIISGEDTRTTLMIKNIPNKYTSKMLLAAIDENHKGTYDFLYLPIDFKNKCNVGYAFINMLSPSDVVPFYQEFNGKKWEKFNSEKVASLAYARIQGKTALVAHFQNSSLMNEDRKCRPIVFHSEGDEINAQEALLSSNLNVCIRQPDGSYSREPLESPKGNSDNH